MHTDWCHSLCHACMMHASMQDSSAYLQEDTILVVRSLAVFCSTCCAITCCHAVCQPEPRAVGEEVSFDL